MPVNYHDTDAVIGEQQEVSEVTPIKYVEKARNSKTTFPNGAEIVDTFWEKNEKMKNFVNYSTLFCLCQKVYPLIWSLEIKHTPEK